MPLIIGRSGATTGASSNVTMLVPMPPEAEPGRLAILTISQERGGIPAIETDGWVLEQAIENGTHMAVVKAWKYLTTADIDAGGIRVNVPATRRMSATLVLLSGAGVPVFTHGAFFQGVSTDSVVIHPGASANAGDIILGVASVTSRGATGDPASWLRTFTPGAGFTEEGEHGSSATTTVNAYTYINQRAVSVTGAQASQTVTVDRGANSYYASTVVVPPTSTGPTADAGADTTGTEPWTVDVRLDGIASDPASTITGHTWRQLAGPRVTLSGTSAGRTYTAPGTVHGTTLTFGYTATNADGVTSPEDTVSHEVMACTEVWVDGAGVLRPLQMVVAGEVIVGEPLGAETGPDTVKPTAVTGLQVTGATATTISFSWNAATDNVGVKNYRLRRSGTYIGQTSSLTYTLTGLTASTDYTFSVQTYDTSDNTSAAVEIPARTTAA